MGFLNKRKQHTQLELFRVDVQNGQVWLFAIPSLEALVLDVNELRHGAGVGLEQIANRILESEFLEGSIEGIAEIWIEGGIKR